MNRLFFDRLMLTFLMLCSVTMLFPATVAAQSYANLVWEKLQAVYTFADQNGYAPQNYFVGKMDQGQSDAWTLTLSGGNSYLILGACDGDCKDIDIVLYDENGNEIDSDMTDDAVPTLEGNVGSTARFTIQTDMYACSAEPCYFGLGVFYRPIEQ